MSQNSSFTKGEVISGGFEARCAGDDGALYIWHQGYGLRVDDRRHATTLLLDPDVLPEGPWVPTLFGLQELDAAAAVRE